MAEQRQITTQQVQAAAEGVEIVGDGRRIDFQNESFRMAASVGLMPLMKFAHVSSKGVDSADMEGLAAMYSMIQDCIDPADWPRFEQHAIDTKAEGEELFGLVTRVIEILSARPTVRPTDSSPGPQPTSENSKVPSSSPATRPTLALVDGTDTDMVSVQALLARSTA